MSGAILGWGIDLGPYDSAAAKLFDDPDCMSDTEGWGMYVYGAGHNRLALLLDRSLVQNDNKSTDFSVDVKVTLGSTGFPVLSSQPTGTEIDELVSLIEAVRPDKGTIELNLDLLLLPAD
jgi:hypothetical protein